MPDGRSPARPGRRPPHSARPGLDSCSGQNRPPRVSGAKVGFPLTDRFRVVWAILEALALLRLQRSRPSLAFNPYGLAGGGSRPG